MASSWPIYGQLWTQNSALQSSEYKFLPAKNKYFPAGFFFLRNYMF